MGDLETQSPMFATTVVWAAYLVLRASWKLGACLTRADAPSPCCDRHKRRSPGYNRLMELEEEGTHARVKRIQRDLIEPSIAEHHNRLVKTTGDGFIAIFDSPLEAVRCGIVIQQNMSARNTSRPRDQQIQYRIGINLGDVINRRR